MLAHGLSGCLLRRVTGAKGSGLRGARGLRSGLSMESQLARDIKAKIRDALTLHSDDWMEKVYARAADFVSKAYRSLAG